MFENLFSKAASFPVTMKYVYLFMALGLALSGFTAFFFGMNPVLSTALFSNSGLLIALIVLEFALVIGISWFMDRISGTAATLMFMVFSIVNGLTLSSVFLVYELGSIFSVFFICAGMFLTMTLIGLFTDKDLSSWGGCLTMALIGLIIAGCVNLFLQSAMFDFVVSIIGVIVFCGLTMYDAQKIKDIMHGYNVEYYNDHVIKLSVFGALTLYLDFVNLFLYLLRLFGNKK